MSLSAKTEIKILDAYNVLDSCEVIVLLIITTLLQIHSHAAPNVYGFLKQAGLMLLAFGLLLNLRFGIRSSYYFYSFLGALFTTLVCLFQYYFSTSHGHQHFLKLPEYVWYLGTSGFFLFSSIYGFYFRKKNSNVSNQAPSIYNILGMILLSIYICLALFNLIVTFSR